MNLTIKQRVILLTMSAGFIGNMVSLRDVRTFREDVALTDEEQKTVNLRHTDSGDLQWDEPVPIIRDIDVPDRAKELVAASLVKMDEAGGLSLDHLELYDLFVVDESQNGHKPGAEIVEQVEAS